MAQEDSTTPNNEQQDSSLSGRNALIEQARTFLNSSSIHPENEDTKRAFLLDKGLEEQEINTLLRESPRILPPVPPRTYPSPPPSNLSLYIALLLRLTMWTVGITGTLTFLYKRLLLGRITASLAARHQLVLHQTDLITRLQTHIKALREEQRTAYKPFIQSKALNDDDVSHIKSLQDITIDSDGTPSLSLDKIVRIVFNNSDHAVSFTVDEIVEQLDKTFPRWLQAQGWRETKERVLHELELSDLYSKSETPDTQIWSLTTVDPQPQLPNPETSLNKLRDTITKTHKRETTFQHVFKCLTDFTAFLSRETFQFYTVDTAAFRRNYLGDTTSLSPIQDEVRREIRALKGLVLNRYVLRSFYWRCGFEKCD